MITQPTGSDLAMSSRRVIGFVRSVGAAVLLGGAAAGCDLGDLLDVEDPSRISSEAAESPELAAALVNGVEGNFVCGYGLYMSMVADVSELDKIGVLIGEPLTINRRRPTEFDVWQNGGCTGRGGTSGSYVPLAKARATADDLVDLLGGWTDAEVQDREARMARALLLSGFSLSALGMAFCSAALDQGPEISSLEVFAEAEERFDRAIATGDRLGLSAIVTAATLGRARMRLFQGNMAGASSDARAIPEGFEFTVPTSSATPEVSNRVWWSTWGGLYLQVPEWTRTLTVDGVPDPRVAAISPAGVFGGDGRAYWGHPTKHRNEDDPLPLARWAEAQLIIAEVDGGQSAVNIINNLRLGYGLPPFASTSEAEIQDQVLEERRRELFIEGFRAYDTRRANLTLFPPVDSPYALGQLKFGTYGSATCVPLPAIETLNNPSIRG